MATTSKPSDLHFIVKTGAGRFNADDRKLIRSHVMKGKNLGKIRPPRRRRDLHWADVPPDIVTLSPISDESSPDQGCDGSSSRRTSSAASPDCDSYSAVQSTALGTPRSFGSAASTLGLADSVHPAAVGVILQFSSIAKQLLFPMEPCIFFEKRAENWIAPLAVDPAYLHGKIFTSMYYFDVILPGRPPNAGQRMWYHHHKALSLIRERLLYGDDSDRLSNSTVSVVLGLAGQSLWTGDMRSTMNHMQGIRMIVNLRGGLCTFRSNEKLLTEILRCDLGIAAHSGAKPVFFNGSAASEPYWSYPNLSVFLEQRNPKDFAKHPRRTEKIELADGSPICGELAAAWTVMSDFCSVINAAADSQQRITLDTFLDTMTSVMYRLLNMRFEVASRDETIRLGLLSFTCSVFLPWQHLGTSYLQLASDFRTCFLKTRATMPGFSPQLLLWLLMAGAVSVFDESDESWLKPLLGDAMGGCAGVDSWTKMRDLLTTFMWIDLVHDKMGRRLFSSLPTY